jgi:hypothetical protein
MMSPYEKHRRDEKMKHMVLLVGIGLLMLGMPLAQSTNTAIMADAAGSVLTDTAAPGIRSNDQSQTTDEPPSWANGNFSGVWGYDIWGEVHIPVGWMLGYYRHNTKFGYFYAGFAEFGAENISWFIQGYFFGPFMFGSLGQNESANTTLFVGIGRYNETNYYWRLMGETGPTFFIYGTYTKFD